MTSRDTRTWLEKHGRGCKLGTIPAVVQVHGSDVKKIVPGKWVRIKECEGDWWHSVYVTEVHPDGYFKADR